MKEGKRGEKGGREKDGRKGGKEERRIKGTSSSYLIWCWNGS